MRSVASESDLLAARDARAALIEEWSARPAGDDAPRPPRVLVFASLAIPGPDKSPPGAGVALASGVEALRAACAAWPSGELDRGLDALGPWAAYHVDAGPEAVKARTVALEAALPWGRLLDLDVYRAGGAPLDRAALGLPQRACLVCDEPARECIRAGRHAAGELAARVAALLAPLAPPRHPGTALAAGLVEGALEELDLTPKPGLVDRHDSGSHPDLTYGAMRRSAERLALCFDELVALRGVSGAGPGPLEACVAAGRRGEERMRRAAGSNAHRGLIFLGGLAVLAACDAVREGEAAGEAGLRRRVAALAREFGGRPAAGSEDSPGARARRAHGVDGVLGEAVDGLPSVFGAALPAFRATLAATGDRRRAALRAMAALMQCVDDTTALHRAGAAGLARVRGDGARLAALLDVGADPDAELTRWNDDYREARLTMGGVADCLALTLAFAGSAPGRDPLPA